MDLAAKSISLVGQVFVRLVLLAFMLPLIMFFGVAMAVAWLLDTAQEITGDSNGKD